MAGWVLHSSKSILPRAFFVAGRCKGLSAEGGNPAQYKAGGLLIRGNTIERVAQWKRTYQPPISFSGRLTARLCAVTVVDTAARRSP